MRISKKLLVAGAGVVSLVVCGGTAYATATAVTDAAAPISLTAVAPSAPKVTAEQAITIAHRQVPGAWIREVELDRNGAAPDVWEVKLIKGSQRHEVKVDAATGKITKSGIDDDHGGRGRDHAEDD
ncbi:PepSY domain-containing protein [Nonomuraea sp. NPDC049309]|uniref:PepSY domain-containing protein n=1 Tax=Nonomuraea sp. NPDC049309 TaxID=3364350 RepID=UPI00371D510D